MASGSSFRRLMDNIGELATIPSRVSSAFAEDVNGFIQEEFETERDPYGSKWPELAESTVAKKGHDRIMYETGETERETIALPTRGAGVELRTTEKAGFNQFEGENRPARPVLPSRADLPRKWQDALARRLAEAVGKGRRRK